MCRDLNDLVVFISNNALDNDDEFGILVDSKRLESNLDLVLFEAFRLGYELHVNFWASQSEGSRGPAIIGVIKFENKDVF